MIVDEYLHNIRDKYLIKIEGKIKYHLSNADNALAFYNGISTMNVVLTAGLGFSLIVLTVISAGGLVVALVSGGFTLFITIGSKLETFNNFQLLHSKHIQAYDDYSSLHTRLTACKTEAELNLCIREFDIIESKSHIQKVKNCPWKCFSCLKRR